MQIEAKLQCLGLQLPEAPKAPAGVTISFGWARVRGNRVYLAGHSPQALDGTFAGPFGKVPSEVSLDIAHAAARSTGLSMLASLKRAIGDLDLVTAWLMVYGMVNADPSFGHTTNAINGFSELIHELFGPDIGHHARVAVGMASLPLNNAVTIAAEVEFDGSTLATVALSLGAHASAAAARSSSGLAPVARRRHDKTRQLQTFGIASPAMPMPHTGRE